MSIKVINDVVIGEAESVAELSDKRLHTMSLSVEPVRNESHWHHFDAEFHILSGELEITDIERGEVHKAQAGSAVFVPARVLHKEYSETGYELVLGSSVPAEEFGDPVDRSPLELQKNTGD